MNFYWLAVLLGASGTSFVLTLTENGTLFISITAQQVQIMETCSDALVLNIMDALHTQMVTFLNYLTQHHNNTVRLLN